MQQTRKISTNSKQEKTDSASKERLLRVRDCTHTPCIQRDPQSKQGLGKLRPSLFYRVVGVEVFEASSPFRSGQFEQRQEG